MSEETVTLKRRDFVFYISQRERTSLLEVRKMFVGRFYNKVSWNNIQDDERQVINMLMAMGFLDWEKVKSGTQIITSEEHWNHDAMNEIQE